MELLPTILKLLVIFSAFVGFTIAFYIFNKKKTKRPMVCPIGGKCDSVVTSKYSKFMGVDLTIGGMGYYGFIAITYATLLVLGPKVPDEITFIVLGISLGAFLFSAYLTSLQAFVLKNWCTWCLCSATISTLIAIFSLWGLPIDLIALLAEHKDLIVILHALAAAVGVGATTVTDISFVRYLRDYEIDQIESQSMRTYSQIIWFALGLLIITGLGLYIPEAVILNESSKFLLKAVVVGVITLNGVILNLFVTPRLTSVKFATKSKSLGKSARLTRKVIYASGAISLLSWYITFVLGSLPSIPWKFKEALFAYVVLLILGLLCSQVYEKLIVKKAASDLAEE